MDSDGTETESFIDTQQIVEHEPVVRKLPDRMASSGRRLVTGAPLLNQLVIQMASSKDNAP